jgi:hypothetical protein
VTDEHALRWRNRRRLILIFLAFFVPTLLAWLLVLNGWRPGEPTAQHGVLVQPPVPVAELALVKDTGAELQPKAFDGRWSMMLVAGGTCGDACAYMLDRLFRVYISLNKDVDRVQLLLVLPQEAPAPANMPDGLPLLRLPQPAIAGLADPESAAVHLVDPYGFRMMYYQPPLDAEGLLKDLRRLLRLSNEDVERFVRTGAGADE